MAARERLQSIDVYRGIALICMAAYHACWDLTYYGLIETGIGIDPLWITAQRTILTSFLLLAGAGLTLAHGDGIRWRPFLRREAVLVAAAAAVTAGTWFLLQDEFAYFGVLHLIALGSALALLLVRAPLWTGILVAVVVLGLPAVYSSDVFDPRWLSWIGFFVTTPDTADLVPVFPWFGVMLIGMLGMRVLREAPAFGWSSGNRVVRLLALLGRWSLVFYLAHQLILVGIIAPLAGYLQNAEQAKLTSFTQSCQQSCGTTGDAGYCTAYCRCALDLVVRGDLWGAVNASPRSAGQQADVDGMTKLCTAMASDGQ